HLAHVAFEHLQGFVFDLLGKSIAIDALGIEACCVSLLLESGGVVKTSGGGFAVGGGPLKKYSEGFSATTESGGDTRRQSITRGSSNNQHIFGAIGDGAGLFHI